MVFRPAALARDTHRGSFAISLGTGLCSLIPPHTVHSPTSTATTHTIGNTNNTNLNLPQGKAANTTAAPPTIVNISFGSLEAPKTMGKKKGKGKAKSKGKDQEKGKENESKPAATQPKKVHRYAILLYAGKQKST